MFHIGQEVVCVDLQGDRNIGNPYSKAASNYLQINKVYQISGITTCAGETFLSLHGIHGGWYYKRFRPVEKKKTDISVFTEILNKANKKVRA